MEREPTYFIRVYDDSPENPRRPFHYVREIEEDEREYNAASTTFSDVEIWEVSDEVGVRIFPSDDPRAMTILSSWTRNWHWLDEHEKPGSRNTLAVQ